MHQPVDIQQYVLCFAHPKAFQYWPEVLLIEKQKPAWQAGKFNLPGGKVEEGEAIHVAAARELQEETGIECSLDDIHLLGTIEGDFGIVYVCRCEYDSLRGRNAPKTVEIESIFWMPLTEALNHECLMDNLRLIIPLCRAGLVGWTLREPSQGTYEVNTNAQT